MTLGRQTATPKIPANAWWNKDGNEVPIRYQVMVMVEHVFIRQPRRARWEHKIGTIVTHMGVEDYCDQHGLKLVEVYHGTRRALPHERTELF